MTAPLCHFGLHPPTHSLILHLLLFKFCRLSHLPFLILCPLLISVPSSFFLSFCLSGFFFTYLISHFSSLSIQSFSSSTSRPPRFPSPFCSFHFPSVVSLYFTGLVPLFPCGADSQPVCVSVCAPVHGQISLSSELQPGSLPPDADADESSSDMLVIVDDPVSSAPQSRATNSPASVSGSVSDNMNGERSNEF